MVVDITSSSSYSTTTTKSFVEDAAASIESSGTGMIVNVDVDDNVDGLSYDDVFEEEHGNDNNNKNNNDNGHLQLQLPMNNNMSHTGSLPSSSSSSQQQQPQQQIKLAKTTTTTSEGTSDPTSVTASSNNNNNSTTTTTKNNNNTNTNTNNHVDQILASEMNKLSVEERTQALEDIHGVSSINMVDETTIQEKLIELGIYLHNHKTKVYKLAESMSSNYVQNQDFRLQFLQADLFDVTSAAKRIFKFLQYKLDLFGSDLLTQDIKLSHLNDIDMNLLNEGCLQILLETDSSGRPILCVFTQLQPQSNYHNMLRVAFYTMMSILDMFPSVIHKGLVSIFYNCHSKPSKLQSINLVWKSFQLRHALPLKTSATHFCTRQLPRPIFHSIFKTFWWKLAKSYMRSRARRHVGDDVEIQNQLRGFGLPIMDCFPVDKYGVMNYQYQQEWLRRRRQMEMEISSSSSSSLLPLSFVSKSSSSIIPNKSFITTYQQQQRRESGGTMVTTTTTTKTAPPSLLGEDSLSSSLLSFIPASISPIPLTTAEDNNNNMINDNDAEMFVGKIKKMEDQTTVASSNKNNNMLLDVVDDDNMMTMQRYNNNNNNIRGELQQQNMMGEEGSADEPLHLSSMSILSTIKKDTIDDDADDMQFMISSEVDTTTNQQQQRHYLQQEPDHNADEIMQSKTFAAVHNVQTTTDLIVVVEEDHPNCNTNSTSSSVLPGVNSHSETTIRRHNDFSSLDRQLPIPSSPQILHQKEASFRLTSNKTNNLISSGSSSPTFPSKSDEPTTAMESSPFVVSVGSYVKPTPNDILFGRGKPMRNHPGNVKFRNILEIHNDEYNMAPKFEKCMIAKRLVRNMSESGSRFLKPTSEGTTGWIIVDNKTAQDKVSQYFRSRRGGAGSKP